MAVGGSNNTVSLETSVCDLAADILVRRANNHTILGGIVFILILDDKAFAGIVVGLALTTPAELDLEPLEVSLTLYDLHEDLKSESQESCTLDNGHINNRPISSTSWQRCVVGFALLSTPIVATNFKAEKATSLTILSFLVEKSTTKWKAHVYNT